MKRKFTAAAASALALSFMLSAPLALAQQAPQHGQDQHNAPQHSETHAPGPQGQQHAQDEHPPGQHEQYEQHQQPMPPMPPPHEQAYEQHHWHHGDHYDGQREVVQDWNHYHLHQPPQGYEWVQDGSQFVLIAVASGIIADIILNSQYQ